MADIDGILVHCSTLNEQLLIVSNSNERKTLIQEHIEKLSLVSCLKIPEFCKDFQWLNVSEKLFLSSQLKGKILVLDFFTYCCINCMHVLPDLHALEQKYSMKDGVVVLGVHSAKFLNEKLTSNILSAVLKYDITHPVVNDAEATLWQKLQVVCWPTFVIVGPDGNYLYNLVGEGHTEELFEFVEAATEYFRSKGQLKDHDLPIMLEKSKIKDTPLRYPGKVEFVQNELIISDTGNNRIIITNNHGVVQEVIGSGNKGYKDGDLDVAMFSSPQGTCRIGQDIYVADTDNHCIRKIDLSTRTVSTVVGTGVMGTDKEGGATGVNQVISSPWDVCVGKSPGSTEDDVLFIAMAGTHQIWAYFILDVTWYKGTKYPANTCIRFAGSGVEENRNNSYPQKAGFAQPSGITISSDTLYIADSESSSVRQISLKDGAVKGLVGGERDPTNLFAYGDVDGKAVEAKLQHPLGVGVSEETGHVYIADSYNHKIKCVDIKTKVCSTVQVQDSLNNNGDNLHNHSVLNEPGGISLDKTTQKLYIADTNNNEIKILDLNTLQVTMLPIIFPDVTDSKQPVTDSKPPVTDSKPPVTDIKDVDVTLKQPVVTVVAGSPVTVSLNIQLQADTTLNTEAPNSWKLVNIDKLKGIKIEGATKGNLTPSLQQSITKLHIPSVGTDFPQTLQFLLQLFICSGSNMTCLVKKVLVEQPVCVSTLNSAVDNILLHVQL